MIGRRAGHGFTLAELLVAMTLATFMLTGILTVVQAATASFRLQQALGQMQDRSRFATRLIEQAIAAAGYVQEPWTAAPAFPALAGGTADGVTARGDRLALQRYSRLNCFDNPNPTLDAGGLPRMDLLETRFQMNASDNLAWTCRYGPPGGPLVTQVNNLGLVEGVEAFQLLFAEDRDGDGQANRFVRAGQWQDVNRVMGVRFALLLASPSSHGPAMAREWQILDAAISTPADGRLRAQAGGAAVIRGRGP